MSRTNSLENRVYATTGVKVDPDTQPDLYTIEGGNTDGTPAVADYFNFQQFRMNALLNEVEEQGILEYSALTNYADGSWCKVGRSVYTSLVDDNKGNTPDSSPSSWKLLPLDEGAYLLESKFSSMYQHFFTTNANETMNAEVSNNQFILIQDGGGGLTESRVLYLPNVTMPAAFFVANFTSQLINIEDYYGNTVPVPVFSFELIGTSNDGAIFAGGTAAMLIGGASTMTPTQSAQFKSLLNISSSNIAVNTYADANHDLEAEDNNALILMTNAGANTVTFDLESVTPFEVGTQITIKQKGDGVTTLVEGDVGVTLESSDGLVIAAKFGMVTAIYEGGDVWAVGGKLTT